jgi:hypothetical protein
LHLRWVHSGEGGAKFKTPALAPAQAIEYLRFHREDAHGQRGAAFRGGADKVHLSKEPPDQLSNEEDGHKFKDQLTNCPDDTLRSALYKAMGDRIDTISVTDLMQEIKVLAMMGQVNNVQQDKGDQRSCSHCGQKCHAKYPSFDLRKTDCTAYGKRCARCQQKGQYAGVCKSRRGDKRDEVQYNSKKTTAGTNHFTINRMKMSEKSGKISRVSQSTQNLMKKQQNMKKLHHEVWDEGENMYIKSGLPEEPKPYVQLSMRDDWYANLGPSKQQKDIALKTSIADTGAQCFLLGSNHLHGLGLDVSSLLQSEINLNCANSIAAGNLGVFFAEVRGEHLETEEVVESRTMVYVIEGDIILVSKAFLENFPPSWTVPG